MASIIRHGERWRAFVGSGKARRTKVFRTKRQAELWVASVDASLPQGYSMHDAIQRYASDVSPRSRSHSWNMRRFQHFTQSLPFIGQRVDRVTPDDIASWRDKRLRKVSPLTVRRELTLLSAVFQTARKEWRWVKHNPCHDVTRPKNPPPRNQVWTNENIEVFLSHTGFNESVITRADEVAVAFLFALETAMRAGEILSLTPDQVRGRVAYLELTKNGDAREVPLSKRALELWGMLDGGFTLDSRQLDALFRKYRDRAGLQGLRFHDTRRTAVSRLAKILEPMELAKMSGHRDLRTLLNTYYRADAESLADRLG